MSTKKNTATENINVGDVFIDKLGSVRVMGIVEGYIVARRPYAHPFVEAEKNFLQRFPYKA